MLWSETGEDKDLKPTTAYITKGDANSENDLGLYDYENRDFMIKKNILGTLLGNTPGIGFMTIAFKENKYFKIFFYSLVIFSGLLGYPEG